MVNIIDYKIENDGSKDVTKDIQNIIDNNNDIIFNKGIYLISNLYLHDNMNIIFEDGCILKGTTNENDIDIIDTRVAGIDMPFYAAVLNIISCKNINIKGKGTILGGGRYYYIKYWGIDKKGGYRAIYDKKNLRFAADYDCKRPRNLLIQKSSNINISDIKLEDSGFWNLHILYSNNINIDNINILSEDPIGPSTDGIDIDSSNNIKISNSIISTNDDGISIKSGRGPDGIRRNIPSYNIKIDNILFNKGYGIAFGSELSAGIYDVDISNIKYENTLSAIRIKSSRNRSGYVKNINISNIKALNVSYLFHFHLDWNKNYNQLFIPKEIKNYPKYYDTLIENIDENTPLTEITNFNIENIESNYDNNYEGVSRLFTLIGYENKPINNINFKNMNINMKEYGILKYSNINISSSNINTKIKYDNKNDDFDNR